MWAMRRIRITLGRWGRGQQCGDGNDEYWEHLQQQAVDGGAALSVIRVAGNAEDNALCHDNPQTHQQVAAEFVTRPHTKEA